MVGSALFGAGAAAAPAGGGAFVAASAAEAAKGRSVSANNRLRDTIDFFILVRAFSVIGYALNSSFAFFLGPNADGIFNGGNEDLAIADLPGLGRLDDCRNRVVQALVIEHDLQFYFRQEIHRVLASAIDFGVAFLTAEPFDFRHCHALDADASERVFDFFQFEWL